uniref:Ribosomal protein S3 n=1 Tax=Gelidiella fanii TaxID=485435 RepID=A0A7G9IW23_9FLOR|nr:ribosomal protein S3 [Gelidiella fanii]
MAQKTNPFGLRLGLTQVWDSILQNYGNKSKKYTSFILNQIELSNFLQHCLYSKSNYFISKILAELNYKSSKMKVSYSVKKNVLDIQQSHFCETPLKKINDVYLRSPNIEVFQESDFSITASILTRYANYLFERKLSLKVILTNLENLLKGNLNSGKIVSLNKGIAKVIFKGFKLKISGRFENTRNRMAKSYEQSSGLLSLTRLNNYVEFHSQTIFTKLGTCTFQVYLFYEIKHAKQKKNT